MQAPANQHHRCSDTADEQHLQRFGRALSIAGEIGAKGLQRVVGHHRIGRQQKANDLEEVGVHTLVAWCLCLKALYSGLGYSSFAELALNSTKPGSCGPRALVNGSRNCRRWPTEGTRSRGGTCGGGSELIGTDRYTNG